MEIGFFESLKAALVCVNPGQEEEWIERLQASDAVKYAELNGVTRIQ